MNISLRNRVFKLMKFKPVFIAAGVFFIFFSASAWAVDNPVGSGLVPPTTFRSGLVQSPNPIDTSGNLLITGNIRGGRYFRGVVPYRAPSDFVAAAGSVPYSSSSLDSFLRDSAGSEDFGRYTGSYTGRYGQYYSPTATVTTTRAGSRGVFTPPTAYGTASATRLNDRIDDEFTQQTLLGDQQLSGWDTTASYDRYRQSSLAGYPYSAVGDVGTAVSRGVGVSRPLSIGPQQLEKGLLSEVEKYQQSRRLTAGQTQEQMEQFQRQLQYVADRAAELEKELTGDSSSLSGPETPEDVLQSFVRGPADSARTPYGETQIPQIQPPNEQLDIYEQMQQQVGDYQKTIEKPGQPAQSEVDADGQEKTSPLDGLFEQADLSVRARAILGEHETFAGFSEDKFNQYIRAAEQYLKEGKYYRAADAYTLASIYKPDDPLAYAGKGHALFAAGEYMSSALFLSRALEIFPGYVHFKIDVVAMLGDQDKIETRLADVRQWVQMTDAAELRFLLAYVYYQMGRFEWAKRAVDAAYEKMPTPAVTTLKKAIDETIESD